MTKAIQIESILDGIVDEDGAPLSGGSVEFYEAGGTSTAKNVWTEPEQTNPYTSYTLDSNGAAQLYGYGDYCIVVKDSDDTQIYSWDDIKLEEARPVISAVSGAYDHTDDDDILIVTAASTTVVTLLSPDEWKRPLVVKNFNSAAVSVASASGITTYSGSSDTSIFIGNGQTLTLFSDGSTIYAINHQAPILMNSKDTTDDKLNHYLVTAVMNIYSSNPTGGVEVEIVDTYGINAGDLDFTRVEDIAKDSTVSGVSLNAAGTQITVANSLLPGDPYVIGAYVERHLVAGGAAPQVRVSNSSDDLLLEFFAAADGSSALDLSTYLTNTSTHVIAIRLMLICQDD